MARALVRLALLALIVLPALVPPGAAQAVLGDAACDVRSGDSLQRAVDAAPPFYEIVVCSGVYFESLTISTSGLRLVGKGGPVLDGSLGQGTRYGIVLAPGVSDVLVQGFEIRAFDDRSRPDDPSSAVLALGNTARVSLDNLSLHDNAWAGLLFANGHHEDVSVTATRFDAHAFAHAYLQNVTGLTLLNNVAAASGEHAFVLGRVSDALVAGNILKGSGYGGIVLAPGLMSKQPGKNVTIRDNNIRGTWAHAVWSLNTDGLVLAGNELSSRRSAFTIGGPPGSAMVGGNEAALGIEWQDTASAEAVFATGPPDSPAATGALSSPVACALRTACTTAAIQSLFTYALDAALNPAKDPRTAADVARLAQCRGGSDACLVSAFFHPGDATPARPWTVNVTLAGGKVAELRFLDAGTRAPADDLARRLRRAALDDEWTTLVLCRLVVAGVPASCAGLSSFDFALATTWAPSAFPREVSAWRLLLPTEDLHASFDRVHGPDATLFKRTTRPHHADSPPPLASDAVVSDPLRREAAGRLDLRCVVGLGDRGLPCPQLPLVEDALAPGLLWCDRPRPDHDPAVHEKLLSEAQTLWDWSASCRPFAGSSETNWSRFLTEADRAALADAHRRYLASLDPASRKTASEDAELVLRRAASRHLALALPGEGMPAAFDVNLLAPGRPTALPATLPVGRQHPAVATDGDRRVFVFGGHGPSGRLDDVLTLDLAAGTVTEGPAKLPTARSGAAAVWTGERALVFGGLLPFVPGVGALASDDILEYDPVAGAVRIVGKLPHATHAATAFFDPRDLPTLGCPGGCAYVLGGLDGAGAPVRGAVRYNPVTHAATLLDTRFGGAHVASYFDGSHAHLLGGSVANAPQDTVYRFDPVRDLLEARPERLPAKLAGAVAVATDAGGLLFGAPGTMARNGILRHDPAKGAITAEPATLPGNVCCGGAVFAGGTALVVGGEQGVAMSRKILGYIPSEGEPNLAALAASGRSYAAVPLDPSNLALLAVDIPDAKAGWLRAADPGLVAFTPARFSFVTLFETLAGAPVALRANVTVWDERAAPGAPVAIQYGGSLYGSLRVADPDNLHPDGDYADPAATAVRTVPLVDVPGEPLQLGTVSFALPLDATALSACIREAWTANATARASNVADGSRLAAAPAANVTCRTLGLPAPRLLRNPTALGLTIEVRQGSATAAHLLVTHEPTAHPVTREDVLAGSFLRDLAALPARPAPTPDEAAVGIVSARLVVTLDATLPPHAKSDVLASLLEAFAGHVSLLAVEIDDLPLTHDLKRALETASGVVTLVPAGVLPEAPRGWHPADRLLSIVGLGAHPHVITVGAVDAQGRVANWSRHGPSSILGPKPDFVAASPPGTTAGAVANVLPFAEALVLQGLRDPHLVRAALAPLSVPTTNTAGAPATFWEQGFGRLGLDVWFQLPATPDLLARVGRSFDRSLADRAAEDLGAAIVGETLGLPPGEVRSAAPAGILGLAHDPGELVRAAIAEQFVRIVLDTPALPHAPIVDFGIVNYEKPGAAHLGPLNLDAVLNATLGAMEERLLRAGYAQEEARRIVAALRPASVEAAASQRVTTNVTHYELFDLTSGDFLYTAMDKLLDAAVADAPAGATSEALDATRRLLSPWKLREHHLVNETTGYATLDAGIGWSCEAIPALNLLDFLDATLLVLRDEAGLLPPASLARVELPRDSRELGLRGHGAFVQSQGNQVLCLHDAREAVAYVRARAEELRALRAMPDGAWDRVDAAADSELGRELAATLAALGLAPSGVRDGSTVVLDMTIDALDRTQETIDGSLRLLAVPSVRAGRPGPADVAVLETNALATRDLARHPFGPYVGLALLTSHDVAVRNPFAPDEVLLVRNFTIPLPSFLHSNPTLTVDVAYRDGTPVVGSEVTLGCQPGRCPRVFERVQVLPWNTTLWNGEVVNVSLRVDPEAMFGPEVAAATSAIEALDGLLDDPAALAGLGPLAPRARSLVGEARASVAAWNATATCARHGLCEDALGEYWSLGLNEAMSRRLSHLKGQAGITDATGRVDLRSLPPGAPLAFPLTIGYPYPLLLAMDRDLEPLAAGAGALAGPLADADLAIHRRAHDDLGALPLHPSAERPPDAPLVEPEGMTLDPFAWTWHPNFEADGRSFGPYHQLRAVLAGADVLAAACVALRDFAEATATPLAFPGCGNPVMAPDLRANLTDLLATVDCLLGERAPADGPCAAFHDNATRAAEACAVSGECGVFARFEENAIRLAAFRALLADLLVPRDELLVPWLKSPTRRMTEDGALFGLTPERLLAETRALNPATALDDAGLEAAIAGALANLTAVARDSLKGVARPPANPLLVHTIAQGILGHTTDRVTGLDWAHHRPGLARGPEAEDADVVATALRVAADLVADPDDRARLLDFAGRAAHPAVRDEALAGWNDGLAASAAHRAGLYLDGWRANGTATRAGLSLDEAVATTTLGQEEVCAEAARATGLHATWLGCGPVEHTPGGNALGEGGVDRVLLANILLEHLRGTTAAALAPGDFGRIVRDAVALAAADPAVDVTRTTDAIRVEKSLAAGLAAPALPAVGVLHYSAPLPVNEHVQYRIQGEILLENTAALLITTTNPAVTKAVICLMDALSLGELPAGGIPSFRVLDHATFNLASLARTSGCDGAALDDPALVASNLPALAQLLASDPDPRVRVDPIGFPLRVEERGTLSDLLAPANPVLGWDARDDCAMTPQTPTLCSQGLLVARPDGYYRYARTFEAQTKGLAGVFGVETLDILLVYLPLVATSEGEARGIDQKVILRDFVVQVDTYLGIEADRAFESYVVEMPLRTRWNVEEYLLHWATPDQPVGAGPAGGVTLAVEGPLGRHDFPREAFVHPPAIGAGRIRGACPDSAAPGFPTTNFTRGARGFGGVGNIYAAAPLLCDRNDVEALRPVHRGGNFDYGAALNPGKKILDALQYVLNVEPIEQFSVGSGAASSGFGHASFDVFDLLGDLNAWQIGNDVSRDALAEVSAALAGAEESGLRLVSAARAAASPVIDVRYATPFTGESFLPGRQHNGARAGVTNLTPLHHYAILDRDAALAIAPGDDAGARIVFRETYRHDLARVVDRDLPAHAHAARLAPVTGDDFSALVVAHHYYDALTVAASEAGEGLERVTLGAVFVGNGRSGAGLAVVVSAISSATLADQDSTEALRGHRATAAAILALSIFRLGDAKSAGSDCEDVPLYGYVRGYFRCAGFNKQDVVIAAGLTASKDRCHDQALVFLAALHAGAVDRATVVPATGASLLAPSRAAPSAHPLALAQGALADSLAAEEAARLLAACTSGNGAYAFAAPHASELAAIRDAVRAIAATGGSARDGEAFHALTEALQPELAAGPQRHGVAVALDAPVDLRSGATSRTGPLDLSFAVEEWARHVEAAWLNVTTTRPDGAVEATSRVLSGPIADALALDLVPGSRHEVTLTAIDASGARATDRLAFLVDAAPPEILTSLPDHLRTNAEGHAAVWRLDDPASGLASAEVVVQRGSSRTVVWSLPSGTSGPVAAEASLDLADLADGGWLVITVTAVDGAGNSRTIRHDVTVDRTPPSLSGSIADVDAAGYLTASRLDTLARARDHVAGLAALRISIVDAATGAEVLLHDLAPGGAPDSGSLADSTRPRPGGSYELRASATDLAGNRRDAVLARAEFAPPPEVASAVPALRWQGTADDLAIRATVGFAAFPEVRVESTAIRVVRLDDGAVVLEHAFLESAGEIGALWAASSAAPGSYLVAYEARHGKAVRYVNATVNVTAPYAGYRNVTLPRMHASLDHATDADVFRHRFTGACAWIEWTLDGGGRDVDLHVAAGDPATRRSNPANYTLHGTGAPSVHTIRIDQPASGTTYSLLVRQNVAGSTPYTLSYRDACGGGGGAPPLDRVTVEKPHVA